MPTYHNGKTKILITGGAGFIGFHLARHLACRTDVAITLVDNLWRGAADKDLKQLLETHPDVTLRILDLADRNAFSELEDDFDCVYHLAAINGTRHFYEIPHEVLRVNVLTLVHLLDWVAGLAQKPKTLFTSSNEAYAGALDAFNQLPLPTPEDVPLVIHEPHNPRWSYAATKLIGELFVTHYARMHHFPAVVVRPHNFYGPRGGYDHVIPELIERIATRRDPFPLHGPDDTRTFCYIEEAVEAMAMLMDAPHVGHEHVETVHIGDTEEIRVGDLAEKLFEVSGWHPRHVEPKPSPPGSVKRRIPDISKIKSLVGWEPRTKLHEGLTKTLKWYAAHPRTERLISLV